MKTEFFKFRTNLSFKYDSSSADVSVLVPNIEWNVESMHGVRNVVKYKNASSHSEILYTLRIQRRTIFHLYNVILPGLIISILVGVTFVLPPSCGERIGLCVTNVLSMMIFSLKIAEQIPRSNTIPILLKFLTNLFIFAVLALVVTCFVVRAKFISHDKGKKNSWFVSTFTNKYLAAMLCRIVSREKNQKFQTFVTKQNIEHKELDHKNEEAEEKKKNGLFIIDIKDKADEGTTSLGDQETEMDYKHACDKAAATWDRLFLLIHIIGIIALFVYSYVVVPNIIVH